MSAAYQTTALLPELHQRSRLSESHRPFLLTRQAFIYLNQTGTMEATRVALAFPGCRPSVLLLNYAPGRAGWNPTTVEGL